MLMPVYSKVTNKSIVENKGNLDVICWLLGKKNVGCIF